MSSATTKPTLLAFFLIATLTLMPLTAGVVCAASANDDVFANTALRELHRLALAAAKIEQAAQDSDTLGCNEAFQNIQTVAHDALVKMHSISFEPKDAIGHVSAILRLSQMTPNGCPDRMVTNTDLLSTEASQAIIALRYDYAIGDRDWHTINASGDVESSNPIRYAESLKNQNYSWVDVRPKDKIIMLVSDWKAEMASIDVNDPSIENSGSNLNAVEVGYRKNSDDGNTTVVFYRTKEAALAAAQKAKEQADAEATQKALTVELLHKFTSLSYMLANHDNGFKLVYAVCKPAGVDAKGQSICADDGSRDWSDTRSAPYRWFSENDGCQEVMTRIYDHHPGDVSNDGLFTSTCVPAPRPTGRFVKGYKMTFALNAPGSDADDYIYADLRDNGAKTVRVFKTFNECYSAMDSVYPKTQMDLGLDGDGNLLSDKTLSISIVANCVRVY
jgi:hypothetical protein